MKKIICFVLVCTYLLTGCSISSDKPEENRKDGISSASGVTVNNISSDGLNIGMFISSGYMCETESGYYYLGGNGSIIQYFDKETDISVPLCVKPECDHVGEDCNGYVAPCVGLSYLNGRLYWVGRDGRSDMDWKIKSMAVDGTDRRTEKNILAFDYGYDGSATLYSPLAAFDGDYVYMMPEQKTIEIGVPNFYYYITRTSISSGEVTELFSLHLSDIGEYSPKTYWTISGNNLYFYYRTFVENSEFGLYRINLSDLSEEVLFKSADVGEEKAKFSVGSLIETPGGLLLMSQGLSFAHGAPCVYAFDKEKDEFEPIYSFDELSESDAKDIVFGSEGIVAAGYDEETLTYTIYVSDFDFKPVCNTEFSILDVIESSGNSMFGSQLLALGQDEVIFLIEQFGGSDDKSYIVACPYSGGKPRVLFEIDNYL